ncbi:DUF5672 family protein [Sphingomonas oleivorans]|uniref:DUF5672 family protein n=1 Tax=Sphingomonas oleivorans TaxID=1735121 RepID=UPI0010570A15|nr:DUF5672 family protein [Sphingomonas oleivorans]
MPARFLNSGPKPKSPALSLDEVTLVAVTSVAIAATVRALRKSQEQARFGSVLLLSDRPPPEVPEDAMAWKQIAPIRSRDEYSRFILDHLAEHIETRFALIVQWDGYVLDGSRWRDEFLNYDYVGAPWPHFEDRQTVGNGGFSLRSKRLLEACRGLQLHKNEAEDVLVCRSYRHELEKKHGLRFAPEHLARQFAYERTEKQGDEFGFHGVFNMIRDMPQAEFSAILAALEPHLLGRRESGEIIREALRRGHFHTLRQGLRQRLSWCR